jgi:hypothetical protein
VTGIGFFLTGYAETYAGDGSPAGFRYDLAALFAGMT